MSLNEWKNNELNRLMMERFGILKEEKENLEELSCSKEQAADRLQAGEATRREQGRLREEELDEAKGEKGDADPLGGKREEFDLDLDWVPDGADKDKDDPDVQEESIEKLVKENRKLRLRIK